MQEVFGGSGHGRDNVGKSLITMAENSEEQVLALLLTSSFLKDDRVRERVAGDHAGDGPASGDLVLGFPSTAIPRDRGAGLRRALGAGTGS